jgi:TRAP transporter TAXI family solute receptor
MHAMLKRLAVALSLIAAVQCCGAAAQSRGRDGGRTSTVLESTHTPGVNDTTVNIISGSPNGTYLWFVYDMSAVLDDAQLRVLPIVGKGGGQNVLDILRLKGVDLGITQTDILRHFKKTGAVGANVADRLVYVTKLYNEELHVLANSSIKDLKDLDGKVVAFGESGSSADVSGRLIFETLGIRPQPVNMNQPDAVLAVKSGKIAATLMLDGKPLPILSVLKESEGVKLLPVPYTQPLEDDYLPAEITAEDYPGLIAPGETLETVAVGAVLAAYNWPRNTDRHQRVARLVNALFNRLAEFQKQPRHPKWKEVNLAALLPGWKRFPAAEEWLEGSSRRTTAAATAAEPAEPAAAPQRAPAGDAGAASGAPGRGGPAPKEAAPAAAPGGNDEALFRQFMEWKRNQR